MDLFVFDRNKWKILMRKKWDRARLFGFYGIPTFCKAPGGVMVSKLDYLIYTSEFESHG